MPRKHCSTRVRNRGNFRLNKDTNMVALFGRTQDSDDWTTWSFRCVSQRHAEDMAASGIAEIAYGEIDGVEQPVGWRMLHPYAAGQATPTTLTWGTMKAVANASNSPLTPSERRQWEKFVVWPLIGDTKAVCVRPRISDHDHDRGMKLLRRCAA